jgi:cell division protein DivIC
MKLKRAGIITKIVIFALIVYAAVTLINMRSQIDAALSTQEELKQQLAEKQATNDQLQYEIDHKGDDDTIADVARNNLNLVAPGEKIFVEAGK